MARSSFHYLKWNFASEVQFTSVIRGHHIYKSVWTPTLGEKLNCREDDRKEAKQRDEYAIGTYLEAYLKAYTGTVFVRLSAQSRISAHLGGRKS